MIQTPLLIVLTFFFIVSCNQTTPPSNSGSTTTNDKTEGSLIDTSAIESMISLHEFLEREQSREIYSEDELKQLKDGINYDSIQKNRNLPLFEKE